MKFSSLAAFLALAALIPSAQAVLTVNNPRCEYLRNPLGIDEVSPRLSWIVESPERGERQTAYQILVASSPELLAQDNGNLWNSGKVSSNETAQIVYGGTALTSRTACYWKVRTWNQDDSVSAWSEPASWTVGLLQNSDWSAKWIDGMVYGTAPQAALPTIVSASFEATSGSPSLNVTSQVAAAVTSGSLLIVNPTTFGSDPAMNVVKQLRVQYQYDGKTFTKIFPEKALMALPADLPPMPANLVITSARYASISGSGFRDVTGTLSTMAANGPFSLTVNNTELGPDPAPNQAKQLSIVYTINGATGAVTIPENRTLNFPADLPAPVPAVVTTAIYEAVDGTGSANVTANLNAKIQNGVYTVTVNNASLNGGVDPAFNHLKRLRVEYTVGGIASVRFVKEGATFTFPADLRIPENVAYLRKSFTLSKPVKQATLYATALGTYEFHLNGGQVGDQWFAPGWTETSKRLRYQAYDVTSQLQSGENVLGAQVSGNWYSGAIGNGFSEHGGLSRALLCQLEVTYNDGSAERFVSDSSWKMKASPTIYSDLMAGEVYDARREIPGWANPGFDASTWSPVLLRTEPTRILNSQAMEPVRELMQIKPLAITQPQAGKWTFDLGQNMVGVVRLKLTAPAGTVVTLRHAEMLNTDGTIYTVNLRGASARDTYICKGGGEEIWQPKFTFHGFRYVELTGLASAPTLDSVTGIVLGSDTPAAGQLATSDQRINQLQSNIVWGQRGNYLSVPTDCPQRDERYGWMGDAQTFIRTATYNADVAAFFTKWMVDVNDSQIGGAYPDIAPYNTAGMGSPAWGDAGVICPWTIYRMYGDTRILEKCYPSMKQWVEWCRARSVNGIRSGNRGNDFGDWLSINADTNKELIGTAFYAHSADLLAKSAAVLGNTTDAATYGALFETIKTAFANKYFNQTTGVSTSPTQCTYALALRFNLLPDALRPKVAQLLENDVIAKGNKLSTGFVGVAHLLPSLSNNGKLATAYKLLQQDAFPSWLFSVKQGATTIWERWDGWTPTGGFQDPGMNSFNHYSLGSCGEWMFNSVAGIDLDPASPGYRKILIRPQPGGTITSANASYTSINGTITSKWSTGNGGFALNVTIPANTTATVYVPAADAASVKESGGPAASAAGVSFLRMEAGSAVYAVQSGSYSFEVNAGAVPGADALGRNEIGRGSISLADLLANDGGSAQFVSLDSTSAHGAKVSLVNGVISYEPQSDIPGGDSFTYTIRNADGGLVTVPVQVAGMSADDTALKATGIGRSESNAIRALFTGVPYRSYRVQFTDTPSNPWQDFGTIKAKADGTFEANDPQTSPNARFYRAAFP